MVLVILALWTVSVLLLAMLMALLVPESRVLWVHSVLALGLMPLILAAMGYFVPVLTRTGAAPLWVRVWPLWAASAGGLLLGAFSWPGWWVRGATLAAVLALVAAMGMSVWMWQQRRRCFGPAHPGMQWYQAACGCLVLALLAVPAMELWPEGRGALRRAHLHLNVLGFVGLTVLGTVHVLLPTALGCADRGVMLRLRRHLGPMLLGVLLVALGVALAWPAVWGVGALLWLLPVMLSLRAWLALPRSVWAGHSPACALFGAMLGLVLLVLAHALAVLTPSATLLGLFLLFLLPLVSGAVSQLLPVWLRPGRQTPWHESARHALARYSGLRVLLCYSAWLCTLLPWSPGLLLAPMAMLPFLYRAVRVVMASQRDGRSH